MRPLFDSFTFDLVSSMRVSYPGRVFAHPVQTGVEGITDAVILDPPTMSVSGVTANTPIISPTGVEPLSLISTATGDRMITLLDLLLRIREAKVPVGVLMSWRAPLWNRWPVVVDAERNTDSGSTIPITVNFEKIRRVTSQLVPSMQDADIVALGQQSVEYGPVSVGQPIG